MYMHIRMPLACLLILLYVLILYCKKRRLHTVTSRVFECVAVLGCVHVLSAVVTEYTVNNRDAVSPLFNLIWHIVFLVSITLFIALLYLYVIMYVERGLSIRQRSAKAALCAVTCISILGELVLPISYVDTAYGSYSYGPKAFSLYLIVVYTISMMVFSVFRYKAVLNQERSFVILASVVVFLAIALIQIVFPYILLTALGVTMVLLGLTASTEDVHMYTSGDLGLFNELGCREILCEAVMNSASFQVAAYFFIGRDEAIADTMRQIRDQLRQSRSKVICGMLADNLLVVIPLQRHGRTAALPPLPQPDCNEDDMNYDMEIFSFSNDKTADEILESLRQSKKRYEADTLMRDELTGFLRRAPFLRQVEYLIESGASFTFLMIDLDNFKEVNDRHGHGVGDDVIRLIAHGIRSELRPTDILCRMGGDEFGIALPEVHSRDVVIQITNRLQQRLQAVQAEYNMGTRVTLSIGAKISPSNGRSRSFRAIYAEADSALYRSKYKGKNRLTFSDDML